MKGTNYGAAKPVNRSDFSKKTNARFDHLYQEYDPVNRTFYNAKDPAATNNIDKLPNDGTIP